MKYEFILAAALAMLTVGCETDRMVDVETFRFTSETSGSHELTPSLAVDIFREVATRLGYIVEGPLQGTRTFIEYIAHAPRDSRVKKPSIDLWIDAKHIEFLSKMYGTAKVLPEIKRVAALFEQALDNRGVQYKTLSWKRIIPG